MAPRQLRLIGPAAMLHTIGETGIYLFTAEVKIGLARVTDRPAADTLGQVEQAGLVGHLRAGLGGHQTARRGRRDGGLLIARTLAEKSTRSDRDNARRRGGSHCGGGGARLGS